MDYNCKSKLLKRQYLSDVIEDSQDFEESQSILPSIYKKSKQEIDDKFGSPTYEQLESVPQKQEAQCPGQVDNEPPKIITEDCPDNDKRNEYFGCLITEDLKSVPPCMRTTVYRHILKIVEAFKKKHVSQYDVKITFPAPVKVRRSKKTPREISGWTYVPILPKYDPIPRKEFKLVEKRRTAAEQFKEDHERRSGILKTRSRYPIEDPDQHNKRVPEMTIELKKKKSDANVKTVKLHGITFNYDSECKTCRLIKAYNELKKLNLQPKCYKEAVCNGHLSKDMGKKRTQRRRSRRNKLIVIDNHPNSKEGSVASYFIPTPKPSENRTKVASQRGCQCSHCSPIVTLADSVKSISISGKSTASSNSILKSLENRLNQRSYNQEEKGMPARHPSMSSYNSFLSADHEPMVMG